MHQGDPPLGQRRGRQRLEVMNRKKDSLRQKCQDGMKLNELLRQLSLEALRSVMMKTELASLDKVAADLDRDRQWDRVRPGQELEGGGRLEDV